MNVGSLFSGIGGFDLGLERAGFRTAWFCEQDEFCQRVLAKHWPGVPIYPDIRDLGMGSAQQDDGEDAPTEVESVDVLCGGFPCQPVSRTGNRHAQDDERWLWPEFARIIGELRPRYVLVENVPGLLDRGMGDVLSDLAALGFDAEWDCLPAAAFGAGHIRERVWLVAYPAGEHGPSPRLLVPDAIRRSSVQPRGLPRHLVDGGRVAANLWGTPAPDVSVLVHGVPESVAANGALGNSLVPQIAEWIGRRLMEHETASKAAA